MSIELTLEPLTIKEGKSDTEPINTAADWQMIKEKLQDLGLLDGYIIVWQIHCISWGILKEGDISFSTVTPKPELILELRVFNENAELHLKKQGDRFVGRYRNDETGNVSEYVDSSSRFWGQYEKHQNNENNEFINLVDKDRKLSMQIPNIDTPAEYYALETRCYIGIHPQTAQAGYIDYRFKSIIPADITKEMIKNVQTGNSTV